MKYGEIVQLGRHRLMCGDATSYEDIEALLDGRKVDLVLTDPPYGLKNWHGNYTMSSKFDPWGSRKVNPANHNVKMLNNKDTGSAHKNYDIVKHFTDKLIFWGGNYFTEFLPPSKGWIIWYKRQSLYNHSQCELAWTSFNKPVKFYEQLWSGACRAGSHALNPRPCVHPTQKPVELHMNILNDFSQPGNVILDCFGGSGTTLIASELTGRTCLMMELSPDYCEVIINRYNTLTQGNIPFSN